MNMSARRAFLAVFTLVVVLVVLFFFVIILITACIESILGFFVTRRVTALKTPFRAINVLWPDGVYLQVGVCLQSQDVSELGSLMWIESTHHLYFIPAALVHCKVTFIIEFGVFIVLYAAAFTRVCVLVV